MIDMVHTTSPRNLQQLSPVLQSETLNGIYQLLQSEIVLPFLFSYGDCFDDLFTDLISGTALTIKFTTDVQGDNVFTMSAICTSLDLNAGVEENTSYSASFEVTGAIVKTTKA